MKDIEMRRLMSRWVFEMALLMKNEWPEMTQSEALKKAHLAAKLLRSLGNGVVPFTYLKNDGSLRKAVGTLCKGISDDFDGYERKTESEDDGHQNLTISYWDLERNAFRSFSVQHLIKINEPDDGRGRV